MKSQFVLGLCLALLGALISFFGGALYWSSRTDSQWMLLTLGAIGLCLGLFVILRGIFRLVQPTTAAKWQVSPYYRYGTLGVFALVFAFGIFGQAQRSSERAQVVEMTDSYFSLRDDFWFELKAIAQSQDEEKFSAFVEEAQTRYQPQFQDTLADLGGKSFVEAQHQDFQKILASDIYYHLTLLEKMQAGELAINSSAEEWGDIGMAVEKSYGQMLPYIKEKGFRRPASIR